MLPAGAGALFSFFARLHTGLSYTTGREKANGILDISRFFHIWPALRQGRGPSVIGRRFRWDRCRVGPAAWFPARDRAGGAVGYCVPFGWSGLFRCLGAQRPGGAADSGGGARLSLKKVGGKNTRGKPLDPAFIAARSHSLVFGMVGSGTVVRLFPPVCQNRFGTHFPEKYAEKHFMKESLQIRVRRWAAKYPHDRDNVAQTPKRASGSKRAIKLGVQGACPRPSFSPFLGRNGDPRRAGGATGRCAPRWLPRHSPRGYAAPCRPWQVVRFGPSQVRTCDVGSPPGPGRGDPGFL